MRIGVVTFPDSNSDVDALNALAVAGVEPVSLWHESPDLQGVAGVILPGGFAYGDYLRAGVIARFSPVMRGVSDFAAKGGLVLGICNGFQVLAESGLVPGALLRNRSLRFAGRLVRIKPEALGRVIKPQTALELTQMMESVVTGGTGTAAAIPGIRVAGKTGTAENGTGQPNTTWFISFAPADAPRVAVAVVLQNQTGVGGTTAAPIARQIMQAILTKTANSNS